MRATLFFGASSLAFVGAALVPRSVAAQVSGVVVDALTQKPIAGAEVRVRATAVETKSDAAGAFSLPGAMGVKIHVVAGMPGYFNAGVQVTTPKVGVVIAMSAVPQDDAPAYDFVDPALCAFCHPNQLVGWQQSPMAHAGLNTWVYDAYDGTGTPGGMGGFV
ncbi:MAG TPA: carboxypeptidase regulatory-like domain-containing protein, partial [Polyangiaceae bacterium]